jgi:hypothetical protein
MGTGPRLWTPRRLRIAVAGVGLLYLVTAGVNAGLTIARPSVYATFADQALFGWVTTLWHATFGAHGLLFGVLLAAGELALSLALLSKTFLSQLGLIGVIAFHLSLMVFGWWAWFWAVPALTLLIPLTVAVWHNARYAKSGAER